MNMYDDWTGNEKLLGQYRENKHVINLYRADNGFFRARIDHGPLSVTTDLAYSADTAERALSLAIGFCKD